MKRQNAETDKAFRILDICNELLNWILMIILVILFCYGTYGIGDSYMLEENAMPEQYEIYRPTEEDYGDFDELKAQNSDVCGWITIYGTHVDYPVVQSEDNSTYLMRNPRGEYSLSGSIFMDYMNQKDFSDFNTIIYGHHMDGGAMFGDFDRYLDPSFADSHLYGNVFANGKDYGLELFAFLELDAYNTGLYVTPVQEVSRKEQYLQEIEDTALWYRQISLSTEDRLVVMSTCTENITNGRHILIGKLSKQTYKDTYKKTLKRNSQIDRIDWGIFWKTSMKRLGVLILLLFSILLLMAVERSGKRKITVENWKTDRGMYVKSERYKQRIKLVCLAFLMMVCVVIPNQVYAAGKNKEAALTVEQTVKGKTNGTTDEFQYELTSLGSGNPMPEGSNGDRLKFSLKGNESKELVFSYEEAATYRYQLKQVVEKDDKDYDGQVYTIENYVMQNGSEDFLVKTAIKRKDGNKSPTLSFTIQHKAKDETPVKNTASVPKSGDDQSFISLIVLILSALLIIVVYKWNKNRRV